MADRRSPGFRARRAALACRAGAIGMAAGLALAICLPAASRPARLTESGVMAAGDRDRVQVTNRARVGIDQLYVSPSSSDDWGEDRLADTSLAPGRSVQVRLVRAQGCVVDAQAVYEDGSREEKHGLDVCRERQITFDGNGVISPPAIAAPTRRVAVVDDSGRPIQQVFISPGAASDWGDDLLGGNTISTGERAEVTYSGGCVADLRVVYDNRSAEERRDIDMCALGGVRIIPGWTTADTLAPLSPAATAGTPAPAPAAAAAAAVAPAAAAAPAAGAASAAHVAK